MKYSVEKTVETRLSRNRLLWTSGLGWLFDAMDVLLLSFVIVAISAESRLTPTAKGWIGSVNSIGMAIGAFVFGLYADRRGRKAAFILTLLLLVSPAVAAPSLGDWGASWSSGFSLD